MILGNIAQTLQEEGRIDEALTWYDRALQADPSLARTYANLASCLAEQERTPEARTAYEEALRRDPDWAEANTHWNRVLPNRMLEVQYEDLVKNPDAEVRRMLDWLGVGRCLPLVSRNGAPSSDREPRSSSTTGLQALHRSLAALLSVVARSVRPITGGTHSMTRRRV